MMLHLFAVDAMKKVEEIKAKRQNQFIINRFVFGHCYITIITSLCHIKHVEFVQKVQ